MVIISKDKLIKMINIGFIVIKPDSKGNIFFLFLCDINLKHKNNTIKNYQ